MTDEVFYGLFMPLSDNKPIGKLIKQADYSKYCARNGRKDLYRKESIQKIMKRFNITLEEFEDFSNHVGTLIYIEYLFCFI
eukprot:Awhi_evm1s5619